MSKPPDRPLQRTRLESADLAAAWEEHAAEFIAWAREPERIPLFLHIRALKPR
jgi:hypothetical protein